MDPTLLDRLSERVVLFAPRLLTALVVLAVAWIGARIASRVVCRLGKHVRAVEVVDILARTIALRPDVVLLDEPCSGLDPISTLKIEEAMRALRSRVTWVLVTNNTKQAARVSDRTAFFLLGDLVEEGPTAQLFTRPRDRRTGDYLEGRFG